MLGGVDKPSHLVVVNQYTGSLATIGGGIYLLQRHSASLLPVFCYSVCLPVW